MAKRRGLALLLLGLMLVQLVPAPAAAYHQGDAVATPDPEDPPQPRWPSTYPTVDAAIDAALARQRAAVALLNEGLREKGAHPKDYAPALPADVFVDRVDPGTRVGGVGDWARIGGNWSVLPDAGREGSAAWSVRNATTGHYAHMDAVLVSPLLDLSAYLVDSYPFLSTTDGQLTPGRTINQQCVSGWDFLNRTLMGTGLVGDGFLGALGTTCSQIQRLGPSSGLVSDQVLLTFAHRYALPQGVDGAQVLLFQGSRQPQASSEGVLLIPMDGYGAYASASSLGGLGFTGSSDWTGAAFDLTPYAGNPVRIGFRVATSEGAAVNPSYFDRLGPAPGWDVDDLRVVAPAYPNNLKVVEIEGPGFLRPGDRAFSTPPDEPLNLTVHLLNAASSTREARMRVTGNGPGNASFEHVVARVLRPGEVWSHPVGFTSPSEEEVPYSVRAQAWNPDPTGNRSLPDPTLTDNRAERVLQSLAVRQASLDLVPSELIVDDEQPIRAIATLRNEGNVPLEGVLALDETYELLGEDVTIEHDRLALALEPGEERVLEWSVTSSVRREHRLVARFTDPHMGTVEDAVSYFVHASPPNAFFNGNGEAPDEDWTMLRPNMPVPEIDEGMWMARYNTGNVILRVLPLPDAALESSVYTDLELTLRYLPQNVVAPTEVSLVYTTPVAHSQISQVSGGSTTTVWSGTIPIPSNDQFERELALSWRTERLQVVPLEQDGYLPEAWGAGAYELHLTTMSAAQGKDAGFFLDDLRLTGVPAGKDEASRRELMRATGLPGDRAEPAQPSSSGSASSPTGPCTGVLGKSVNCWRRVSYEDALADSTNPKFLRWRSQIDGQPPSLDGERALWTYVGTADDRADGHENDRSLSRDPNRLVTPIIDLRQADDPILTFDHTYSMPGHPLDRGEAAYAISQIGMVEAQYLREDGTWSPFYRLEPPEGYSDPLKYSYGDTVRKAYSGYQGGDGYFWPSKCRDTAKQACVAGTHGFYWNYGDAQRRWHLVEFPPLPTQHARFPLNGQLSLEGVNLSGKMIRIGFNVPTYEPGAAGENPTAHWTIGNVRVAPVSTFAVDAAIANVSLEVPYDWKKIGVGPGTTVPVNVTVRNVGLFAESFVVHLDVSEFNGGLVRTETKTIGLLARDENKSVIVDWDVPLDEDKLYVVTARVASASELTPDENRFNDVAVIGADGTLRARTVADVALVSTVRPEDGRETLGRQMPAYVLNRGNVVVNDVVLARSIERLEGTGLTPVSSALIRLTEPVPPSELPVRIETLGPMVGDRGYRVDDAYFTPGVVGRYRYTLIALVPEGDSDASDNTVRLFFQAKKPLSEDDFEDALRWTTNDAQTWGRGPGFNSSGGLLAANRTSGAIPPETDAWIVSPTIPLAVARSASVNLYHKHDLEHAYDAGRVEVSIDEGRTWHPVPPLVEVGRKADYPTVIVGSNPLAANVSPDAALRALTGDTRHDPAHRGGWIPASFDLMSVPALVEEVPFQRLHAPLPDANPLVSLETGVYSASWMVTDVQEDAGRWEIHNLTEGIGARSGKMWWSGTATQRPTLAEGQIRREFSLEGIDPDATMVLSWWDTRAGASQTRWQGVGAEYAVRAYQLDSLGRKVDLLDWQRMAPVVREGPWNLLSVPLSQVNFDKPLVVVFNMTSQGTEINSTGWAVEDIDLRAVRLTGGVAQAVRVLTGDDESDWTNWVVEKGWSRVDRIPSRPARWEVVQGNTDDGLSAPMWRLDLAPWKQNVDTRLVTPEVDLTKLGSGRAYLRLGHDYNLLASEVLVPPTAKPWQGIAYQGATVEIQVFNRTTGKPDPWRQLYALPDPPTSSVAARPDDVETSDGAPYTHVLPDVGDSFERFPREWLRFMGFPANGFYRGTLSESSYAFSDRSTGQPYDVDEFDLSQYVGERVRFGFHAWTGGAEDGFSATPRHWRIADVQVVGSVMSARDAQLRFRLGTDLSGLQGSWSIDQYEVTGITYGRSVGIHFTQRPERIAPGEVATIQGYLQNYGPEDRLLVGIGLADGGFERAVALSDLGNFSAVPPEGFAAALQFPKLERAGSPNSTANFTFQVYASPLTGPKRLVLQVLDLDPATGAFAPAEDDVPGRSRRVWTMDVESRSEVTFDAPRVSPPYLAAPGAVVASLPGVNVGTLKTDVEGQVEWRDADGRVLDGTQKTLSKKNVEAGAAFTLDAPPILLPAEGNYTVHFTIGGVEREAIVRVGVGDVPLRSDFDDGSSGWRPSPDNGWRFEPQGRRGTASALFGLNESEYGRGLRIGDSARSGDLRSPPVDLRHLGEGAVLTFWHRPGFDSMGSARAVVSIAGSDCEAPVGPLITGRASTWQYAEIPLAGVTCAGQSVLGSSATITFQVRNADGQGWRVDDVAVVDGPLRVSPGALDFQIVDSARKRYPFLVENPGRTPREVVPGLDLDASKLTPLQSKWFSFEPERLVIPPGGSAVVSLVAETPAARGAFPQAVRAALAAVDLAAPGVRAAGAVRLDFAPLPRQDVQALVEASGKTLTTEARSSLEEGVSHAITVTLTNQGVEASGPTQVLLQAVRDRDGRVVHEHREEMPGLGPYALTEESYVFSTTWRPEFGERENFTLRVVVDPDRRQVDYDRSNDDLDLPVRVVRLVRPDLVVDPAGFVVSSGEGRRLYEAVPGELLRLEALVRNDGFAPARDVTVRVLAGNSVLKEELVPLLRPGEGYRVRVNQFAPDASITYRVLTFTTDLELSAANNEHTLEVPIYPPEIQIALREPRLPIEPGASVVVPVEVRNEGPHPVLLNLTVAGVGGAYALERELVALGPNEVRAVDLTVAVPNQAAAGERLVVLRAIEDNVVRAQRTLPVDVAARPAAALLPLGAKGAPAAVRVEVEVANTGNVALDPEVVAYGADGAELGRFAVGSLERGRSRLVTGELPLPPHTPPGRLPVRVAVEDPSRGTLAEGALDARLEKWGEVRTQAEAVDAASAQGFDVRVTFDGNAPSERRVLLYGLPPGVNATVVPERLRLEPGDATTLTVRFGTGGAPPGGLYAVHLALVEDEAIGRPEIVLPNLTSLPLDLRLALMESLSVERRGAETPRQGDTVLYAVKVRNAGDRAARDVPVGLYVDGVLAVRETIEALAPGETREVTLAWTAEAGEHGIIVAVDPHGQHRSDAPAFSESLRVESTLPQQIAAGAAGHGLPIGVIVVSAIAILAFGFLLLRRRKA